MSLLSAVPRVVVAAMQIALVALLVFTVIPIAAGGLNVDINDSAGMEYDEETHTFTMQVSVNIDADLAFDITGLRVDAWMTSGGQKLLVYESETMTVPKKSSDTYTFELNIPLTTVMMMMLTTLDDHGSYMTVNVYASTLGGMISVSAGINIPVAYDAEFPEIEKELTEEGLTVSFNVPNEGMIGDLFETISEKNVSGMIGNAEFRFEMITDGDEYAVKLEMLSTTDDSLIDSVRDAPRNGQGGINVDYGGNIVELTEEQTDLIISVLNMLYERWSP